MKTLLLLLPIAGFLFSPVACGMNPVMPLETFSGERGFAALSAIQSGEDGMTHFQVILNPAVFLSHFEHGFPGRKTEVGLSLMSRDDEHFKGPSVDLGSVSSESSEHRISFSVPTRDLDRYQLEFQCSIPPIDEVKVTILGGELYWASLKTIREAKETITEHSAVWKKMEEERRNLTRPSVPAGGRNTFGDGSGKHEGKGEPDAEPATPAPEK